MKKRVIITASIIIVTFLALEIFLYFSDNIRLWPVSIFTTEKKSSTCDFANYFTKDYPTEFFILGDKLTDTEGIAIEYINSLSENELVANDEYCYHILFINDDSDQINLLDEDFKQISDCYDNGWWIFYLGNKYLSEFNERYSLNIVKNDKNWSLGFGYTNAGDRFIVESFWNNDNRIQFAEAKGTTAYANAIRWAFFPIVRWHIEFYMN